MSQETETLVKEEGVSPMKKSSMAPYSIRKYQNRDDKWVRELFFKSMGGITFPLNRGLKSPRILMLLSGGLFILFLVSGSWHLTLLAGLTILITFRFFNKHVWNYFINFTLNTDLSDISKYYFSEQGSCLWVAESEGQVVGMVGALPVNEPALRREHLQLHHLCVDVGYRGQGIGKALVKTVLQFGQDEDYRAVVLNTTIFQPEALALYQGLGFQKTGGFIFTINGRVGLISVTQFTYHLPFRQASKSPRQDD
ncbi:putative N-acetyltransferase 8B [Suncus etruscus]|uniref:putative N-acetyltransferase 8B n=1 Tax=Suncus etruscus TaxID=109475 RepID=UPI00210F3562|nr:putative N-acetyltransferase 8B [Suncus etruscus]